MKKLTPKAELEKIIKQIQTLEAKAYTVYIKAVQELVDKHNTELATGHMSDTWQVSSIEDGQKYWHREYDTDLHFPIFKDLEKLDKIAREIRIGPSNMELFRPSIKIL